MKLATGLVVIGIACSSVFAAEQGQRTLTFDDRVAAQKAIEQVYWNHRIWPKENPGPKPALSAVMSDEAIRAKVEDYLKKSNALETWWQRPITAMQLQAELDRMAKDSRDPELLREVFASLGNDPWVIADTLARQTLADRLIRNWYAFDERFHGSLKNKAEMALQACGNIECMNSMGGDHHETVWKLRTNGAPRLMDEPRDTAVYLDADAWAAHATLLAGRLGGAASALPLGRPGRIDETRDAFGTTAILRQTSGEMVTAEVIWSKTPFDSWWSIAKSTQDARVDPGAQVFASPAFATTQCTTESWSPTRADAPNAATGHTAVWTGTEMIVWGDPPSAASRYSPATDTWSSVSLAGTVPTTGDNHTAVWTGTEMIVWGGFSGTGAVNSGGRYNPSTDSWALTSTGANVPEARGVHAAVWTGTTMIVWGGARLDQSGYVALNTGGRYDPATDSWTSTSLGAGAPSPREGPSAIWTGATMIVWGGYTGSSHTNTGGRYDPLTDAWSATSNGVGVPGARSNHTAVWTGTEMIVWGGNTETSVFNTGGRYSPLTDTWASTSTLTAPSERRGHSAVWTGSKMIVWGGFGLSDAFNSGAIYDPSSDTWTQTASGPNTPAPRASHTAVWTGTEMIVWGGNDASLMMSTGGRYNPSTATWTPTSTGTVPLGRSLHSAIWTGLEMIVWGGVGGGNSGGRYNPTTDTWTATTQVNAPSARFIHTAVWTGTTMVVWGGQQVAGSARSDGGRYDPVTDTWAAGGTGTSGLTPRSGHTAVWTGTAMIIWGGGSANGARYDPTTNGWSPIATQNAPSTRADHSAVWTGTEMIVWGGLFNANGGTRYTNTGGRYNPVTNAWATTSIPAIVPQARALHTAVWTGTKMIVWGGKDGFALFSAGGVYDPIANTWTATSTAANVPEGRYSHSAVWTGNEMIVWGGYSQYVGAFNTGGRYDPSSDAWTATSTGANVPFPRDAHTAVWTGKEMIVWGGGGGIATGGRYDPVASISCDDNNSCTDDSCDPALGCVHTDNTAPCDDANVCTTGDTCGGGTCNGGPSPNCDDNNPCTDDSCNPSTGCVHANNTNPCSDGNACTAGDVCGGGSCRGTALNCDDGNPCTDDSCNPSSGCVHTNNTAPCDDGNACTTNDTCLGGTCNPGWPIFCVDNNPCTTDTCNPTTGCVHTPNNRPCSDGNACTGIDSCGGGVCNSGPPVVCDDRNVCTTDTCNPATGCVFTNNTNACDDGNACTIGDTCGEGTCHAGTAADCNDHNLCTTDTCNPATGCVFTNNTNSCDDGNACSVGDRCGGGACHSGAPVVCVPPDGCHVAGVCDPATGACSSVNAPDGTVCSDNNLCTTGDVCQSGVCTPTFNGLNHPRPKSAGYYGQLCDGGHDHGHAAYHGDQLTDADALCVAGLTATFDYLRTVDDICNVLDDDNDHGWHGGRHHGCNGNGPDGHDCDKAENELIATALNICRARVCLAQDLDSRCHGNNHATVAQSLADGDAILDNGSRDQRTCSAARCELREINNGHALEMNTLVLSMDKGRVRLTWEQPVMDDGADAPSYYELWRRPMRSGVDFTKIGQTTGLTFLDMTAGTAVWEYEISAVMP